MSKFVVGGTEYTVPPLSLKKLKIAWPAITELGIPGKPLPDQASCILAIVSAGLGGTPTLDELEDAAMLSDFHSLVDSVQQLFEESGLKGSGEAPTSPEV